MDSLNRDLVLHGFKVEEDEWGVSATLTSRKMLESNLTKVVFPVIYIIIFIIGLPNNAIAIWVFLFRTKKRHPASILMASLALADLFFVIWLPLKIAYHFNGNNWIFGETLCKVLVGSFYSNMYCSTLFIVCISVHRYWAVVHPLSNKLNNRVAGCVSVLIWVMVWLLSIPLYLYDQTVKISNLNITTCHDVARFSQSHLPVAYFLTMGIVGFVVPCIVCVVAYVLMFYHLGNSTIDSSSGKKKKKAIRLMIVVLVLFLVCFTPSNILLMVHYSQLAAGFQNDVYGAYIVALCLSSLNSCIDPFVYYFISEEFRNHVKNTLMCRSERTAKRMKVSFSALKFSKSNNQANQRQSSTYTSDTTGTQTSSC
ncbi:proteinase-activated receptor 2-like [Trichomycterus rosablanca]|uniref:proteinase-activated receptor 2-like n=1 Tax=Trichomycterus rosablanca TaxID=2290929 RepID=UPI002F35A647